VWHNPGFEYFDFGNMPENEMPPLVPFHDDNGDDNGGGDMVVMEDDPLIFFSA